MRRKTRKCENIDDELRMFDLEKEIVTPDEIPRSRPRPGSFNIGTWIVNNALPISPDWFSYFRRVRRRSSNAAD